MNAMEKEQTRTGKKVFMGNHMIELEELVEEPRLIEVDPMEWQKHLPEQVRKKLKKEIAKMEKKAAAEKAAKEAEERAAKEAEEKAAAAEAGGGASGAEESPEEIAARIAGDRTQAQADILEVAKHTVEEEEAQAEDVAARIERERRERQAALLDLAKQQQKLAEKRG